MKIRKTQDNALRIYLILAFFISLLPQYTKLSPYVFVLLLTIQHLFIIVGCYKKIIWDGVMTALFMLFVYFVFQVAFLGDSIVDFVQVVLFFIIYIGVYVSIKESSFTKSNVRKTSRTSVFIIMLMFVSFYKISETRFGGLYINPNTTAFYGLCFYLFFLLDDTRKIRSRLFLFFIVILLFSLTESRNALLALLIGEFFRLVTIKIKISFFTYVVMLLITLYLVLNILDIVQYVVSELNILNVNSRLLSADDSGRDILFTLSYQDFIQKPLFGWGFSKQLYFESERGSILNSHNSYIDMLVRFGIVGVALYIVMILSFLKKIIQLSCVYYRSLGVMVIFIWSIIIANETFAFKFKSITFFFIVLLSLCVYFGEKK